MPSTMEKHTDEMTFDGATGKWYRRPREINDNVEHGGGWWTTQGVAGLENAAVIGAILYPKADTPFEEEKPDAVQDSKGSGSKVPLQGSKKDHGKSGGKSKDS